MGASDRPDETVYERVERSPEFRELVAARRRFVVPATIFFLAWYLGFILLAGYAPDFMGESVYEGLTVGYVLALSQFLMTAVLGVLYLRRADRVWDPLRERALRVAEGAEGERRDRTGAASTTTPDVPR
jgi:uncharacterized membrane protein (DUF485 family)